MGVPSVFANAKPRLGIAIFVSTKSIAYDFLLCFLCSVVKFCQRDIKMVSFVQDIGDGNKLVWDLDNPNDAKTFNTMMIVLAVFVLLIVVIIAISV